MPAVLATVDHFEPFHCAVPPLPAAMQNEDEVHETPEKLTPGLATVLQVDPFHCAMKYLG